MTEYKSRASKERVIEVAKLLAVQIPQHAKSGTCRSWTAAVHEVFLQMANDQGLDCFPKDRPYKGEYLNDFVIWERGYGTRICCESQWWHPLGDHDHKLRWSFDKLIGSKGDIKVFIYEGKTQETHALCVEYISQTSLWSTDEALLLLQFDQDRPTGWWWKPAANGPQPKESIRFDPIPFETL